VRPVHVVVDPPVLQKDLDFEQGLEALAVQIPVAKPSAERLDPGVLPRRSRIDEDRVGAEEAAPLRDGEGDELGPCVRRPRTAR
jgi:hypothetical protein